MESDLETENEKSVSLVSFNYVFNKYFNKCKYYDNELFRA